MTNLYKLNIKLYWADFTLSTISFIICFFFVYTTNNIIAFILACIFLYRLCSFTHELAHQSNNPNIQQFKFIWNITGGLLMFQHSLRFAKPHLKHHKTGIFATKEDPQYPLIHSNLLLAISIFIILPWFLPLYNIMICIFPRCVLLENILYKNIDFNFTERTEIENYELFYLTCLSFTCILFPTIIIPFYFISVGAWFLSVLRIPLEHSLKEYKKTSVPKDQEVLSMTHENPIYIIIQPLSLRYHKAHHMYPKIPYHNLPDYHYELRRKGVYSIPDVVP